MRWLAAVTLAVTIALVPGPSRTEFGYGALEVELTTYLDGQAGQWAVYVLDLETGIEAGVNADRLFYMASTEKLGTVLVLLDEASRGEVDLDQEIPYQASVHRRGGSGYLQASARDGVTYSLSTLARLSIALSDNIAHAMIVDHLGRDRIVAGLARVNVPSHPGSEATARELGRTAAAVVALRERDTGLGDRLLEDMAGSVWKHGIPDGIPPGITVAHKPGWVRGVTNDVAIVMTDRPYVLVVMSQGVPDWDTGFSVIAAVAGMVNRYQVSS